MDGHHSYWWLILQYGLQQPCPVCLNPNGYKSITLTSTPLQPFKHNPLLFPTFSSHFPLLLPFPSFSLFTNSLQSPHSSALSVLSPAIWQQNVCASRNVSIPALGGIVLFPVSQSPHVFSILWMLLFSPGERGRVLSFLPSGTHRCDVTTAQSTGIIPLSFYPTPPSSLPLFSPLYPDSLSPDFLPLSVSYPHNPYVSLSL